MAAMISRARPGGNRICFASVQRALTGQWVALSCAAFFYLPFRAAMSHSQAIIVPRISTFPAHEAKARMILRWLAARRIVEALPTTCGRGVGGLGYAMASGARIFVEQPDRLAFGAASNGITM